MPTAEYLTILDDCQAEITEKKSRFIANVHHVESEDEAAVYIASVKKACWDARHNCHAYVIGTGLPLERGSPQHWHTCITSLTVLPCCFIAQLCQHLAIAGKGNRTDSRSSFEQ